MLTVRYSRSAGLEKFLSSLSGPQLREAAGRGLREHGAEQRRLSVNVMTRMTGLPKGRVSSVTKQRTISAVETHVRVDDRAIGLHEYGSPTWVRDISPRKFGEGIFRGRVSSMPGAMATGWNRRKVYNKSFVAKGKVFIRKGGKLKMLSGPVLANELVDRKKTNSRSVESYMEADLAQRVLRHVSLAVGGLS
jgi:hypothetical protein